MPHTTHTLTRRLATKLLGRPPARSARLGVESLEARDNPAGTISGFVFQDFNANGAKDTPANIANAGGGGVADATDRGIGGVTVTVFDAGNTPRGTATTNAAGNYTLSATGTGGYRVEFTALPQGLQPGPQGPDSKTAVQFVPDGPSIDVSVGLVRPGDFAQRNPLLATSRYVFGDPVSGANRVEPTIVAFPYSSGGATGNYASNAPTTLATAAQVGTTFGLAYNSVTSDLFTSAYFKRHAGFGPAGPGAIYRIPNANAATPGVPGLYANLNALFPADLPAGANAHDAADYDRDNGNAGWRAVGTTGLGGSDVSDDGKSLYVVALGDRRLYRLPTGGNVTAGAVARQEIPLGNPNAAVITTGFNSNDLRPFAVQFYRGKVYVGVTYTAQTLANGDPNSAAARSQLLAAVYEADPATLAFDPTPVFTARLNYPRDQSAIGFTDASATISPWRPWSATYFSTATNPASTNGVAPQAMLSDISFDVNGNMNLGLRDRGADQVGYYALSDPSRSADQQSNRIEGFTTGDLLRAFVNQPGNLAGGWTLENNASAPGGPATAGANTNSGPGGGEFFSRDNFGTSHGETSMGSLLQLPGRPDVVALQMDPATTARAGGLSWFSNADGTKTKAYQIYVNGSTNNANQEATFSKANGLGGLTALVDPAPIEVGNRVWNDLNGDGRQDAAEPALAGVTVQLIDAAGTVVRAAVTDGNGQYYFSSGPGTSTAAKIFGVPFVRDANYFVRVPNVRGTGRQAALQGLVPTTVRATGVGGSIDSDGTDTGTTSDAGFVAGAALNDHAIDFGFRTPGTSVSGFIYADSNNNGVREGGEALITQSVTLTLTGTDSLGNAVNRTVTTTTGAYTFADVPTSNATGYTITQVNQPSGFLDGTDTSGTPFGGTGGGATETITGVMVNAATGPGTEYNFGEILPAVLGDFVWLDANGNGRFDATETGVNGVTVSLSGTTDRGNFSASTVTAGNGGYLFGGLRPGTYTVTFGNAAGGVTYTRTFQKVGTDTTIDSDADRNSGASDPVTLGVGGSNRTIDAGLFRPVSIGDLVWADTNKNGVRDGTEPGIAGAKVTVTSFGPDGGLGGGDDTTTSVFTGPDGDYLVTGLAPGNFLVSVDPTTGTINGIPATGLAPTYDLDSGTNQPDGRTLLGPVTSGGSNLTADFGFTNFSGAIGDRVWVDLNADGVQQANEPGLAGIPITALFAGADGQFNTADDKTFTATTGANGIYNLTGLPFGTYRVTANTAGTNLLATYDLDSGTAAPDLIAVAAISAANPARADVDFGVRGTATVGDLVWYDIDGDGTRNNAEPGIAGVAVTLTGSGFDGVLGTPDDLVFTTTTDASGKYIFTNLPVFGASDPYRVAVAQPAQYPSQTFDADGLGSANQSTLTLAANDVNLAQDFGYRGPDAQGFGDIVWLDANGNGRFDATESGVNGVTVELLDGAGNALATTLTANNPTGGAPGYYEFRGLIAGDYRARFGNAAGGVTYVRTNQNSAVADDTNNSDASSITGETGPVTVAANTFVPTVDAGLYQFAAIGDTVYRDDDGNGVQNGTEPGLVGVRVILDDAGLDGVFGTADDSLNLASANTVAGGQYLFSNLRPGTYRVRVDATTLPAGLAQTVDLDGLATPNAATAPIASNQTRRDVDFGYRGTNSIGDTVWYDLDRSGAQNNGEPGIAGVVISLTEAGTDGAFGTADDVQIGTRTTDASGQYLFTNLPAGLYRAAVRAASLPAGLAATYDLDSGLTNPDGVADAALGGAAGSQRLDVDFGYRGTGSIGDRVWFDANGDGVQDSGEPGIPGASVALTWAGPDGQFGTPDDLVRAATTGANGIYLFPDLPAGNYTVTVTPTPGLTQTGDPDATLDSTSAVTLAAGQQNLTQDFGYRGLSSLGGTVFVDANNDGVRQATETRIGGVTVTLTGTDTGGNAVTRTATTAADGTYLFANLAPGTYSMTETQPAAYGDGKEVLGSVGGTPSGTVGADRFDGVTLTPGSAGVNYDFGELGATISGVVFQDVNKDGSNQPGEPLLAGVIVTLRDGNGNGVGTTTTGPDGSYAFTSLPAGNYTLTESQPAGFGDSPTGPFSPNTRPVALPAGGAVVNQNFGDTLGTVSGTVYADTNRDGIQNPGEPGLAGVTLQLTTPDGRVIATTTTDASGNYQFAGLPSGTYAIVEAQPAGYADGATTPGPNGGTATSGVRIAAVPLAPGGASPGNLFGEVGTGSVTGVVFTDTNKDGTQQPGEPGIPGVTVQLITPNGTVIATTTTGPDGTYIFPSVAPGTYTVRELQPAGFGSTPNTSGNSRTVTVVNGAATTVPAFPDTLGSIAGIVYVDSDNSGTLTTGDGTLLSTVTLQLLDAAGNLVATTVTDFNGNYRFDNLRAGDYTVVEVQPPLPTSLTDGFYDAADNPGNFGGTSPAKNRIAVALPGGGVATDYNFGELRPASVFGFVYIDANRNGLRDSGEAGIAGVTITISGTPINGLPLGPTTAVTDADGRWEFAVLPPGNYQFTEAQPAGFLDGLESDRDPANRPATVGNDVFSGVTLIAVSPGQARGPLDFGEFHTDPVVTAPPIATLPPAGPLTPIDFFPPAPVVPTTVDPTKRQFLGSTDSPGGGTAGLAAPVLPTAPNFSTRAADPTFVAVAEDVGGGLVRVFDYQSGVERYRFRPYGDFAGGVHAATGDVTGDGVPDIVTTPGVGGGPIIRVYDGLTGQLVREVMAFEESFRGGLQLTVGDITGDGLADVIVAPDAGGGPIVRAFDGRNFSQIANFFALDETFRGGLRLAAADLNADGRGDLIVTAGVGGGPRVAGYDGATLTNSAPSRLFGDFFAFAPELRSGFWVSGADVDGDGYADLVLGAGPGGGPRVATYSGRALTQSNTPTVVGDIFAGDPNSRGGARVKVVDLDGDGRAELVSATGAGDRPVVRVMDPRTGEMRDAFYAFPTDFLGGVAVG